MFNNQVDAAFLQGDSLDGTEWWQVFEARLGKRASENCIKAYDWIAGLDATDRSVQEVSDWHRYNQDLLGFLQSLEYYRHSVSLYELQEYYATVCMLADILQNLANASFYVDWPTRNKVSSIANAIFGAKESLLRTCEWITEVVDDTDEYADVLVHIGAHYSAKASTDSDKVDHAVELLKELRKWLGDTRSEHCQSWSFVYDSLQTVCLMVERRLKKVARKQYEQSPLLQEPSLT